MGSVDVPQQFVAFTDSKLTNTLSAESSLSRRPEIDKYEDLKHANRSDLNIPNSFEDKEITETDSENSGV